MKLEKPIAIGFFTGLLAVFAIAATPIKDLVLQSDLDAAGFAITGLGTSTNTNSAATLGQVQENISSLNLGSASTNDTADFADADQGALADTATQPGDLSAVATSGDYDDLTNRPTLGDAAAKDVGTGSGDVAAGDDSRIVAGGTALQPDGDGSGLTDMTKGQVGLGNVDNTSDAGKPVSDATQTALDGKLDKTGGAVTGQVSVGSTAETDGVLNVYSEGDGSSVAGVVVRASSNPSFSGNSDNLFTLRGSGSSTGKWRGRLTAGGDTVAFLMGEYQSRAWIGAHNSALNAWADFYINPDGTSTLFIGDSDGSGNDNTTPIITVKNGSGAKVGFNTTDPTGTLDVNADKIRVRSAKTPASAGATGNPGEIAWDSNYIYICTAANTWKRVAIATW